MRHHYTKTCLLMVTGLEAVSAGKGEDDLWSSWRARRTLRCILPGPHPLIRVPLAPCRFLTPAWETCQGAAPRLFCSFPTLHVITALTSSTISPQAAGDKEPLLMPLWGPPGVDSVSSADNWPTRTWHSLAPSRGQVTKPAKPPTLTAPMGPTRSKGQRFPPPRASPAHGG